MNHLLFLSKLFVFTRHSLRILSLLFFLSLSSYTSYGQDFYLADNGITCMCPDAEIGESGTLVINGEQKTFTKRTREQITTENAASTCTSGVTDMSSLFSGQTNFNEDISTWDVSDVTDMSNMFFDAHSFNRNISYWEMSKVKNAYRMFLNAVEFNQPIGSWNLSSLENMSGMIGSAFFNFRVKFNQPIGNWDVSKVTNMSGLFEYAPEFNQDIGDWDVSNVTGMQRMFQHASSFDQDIGKWDVASVKDMRQMFVGATSFNQDLGNWDVSSVENMISMFAGATSFNQEISGWCVENIQFEPNNFASNTNLTSENRPVWGTCPTNIIINTNFYLAENGVTCMCPDAEIGEYGTLIINGEERTFRKRSRNQITAANAASTCTSGITDMSELFMEQTNFNEDIIYWDVSEVEDMSRMFFSAERFNQPIGNWDVSSVISMAAMFERSNFNQPIGNWDVSSVTSMGYMFFLSKFNQPLASWNVSNVSNMEAMFQASPFNQIIENWDVSNVNHMDRMFQSTKFDQPIEKWDVSNVTNMTAMFWTSEFNQPIGNWDVSSVTKMDQMFYASVFNQSIENWDVGQVLRMSGMFEGSQFNQDISKWCVINFDSEPSEFSLNAPLKEEFKPIWGTCPESEPLPSPPSVDTDPPQLIHFSFNSTYIQSSLSEYLINFQISDDSFLDTVMIFYKPIRSENRVNWQSTVNAALGNSSVVGGAFDLPNSAFDEIGTIFYLRAVDSNNNVLNTDTMYIYKAYDSNDPISFQTPSFGVSANDFFLFGVPLMLDPNTIEEVIAPNFGGFNTRRWRMFYADGAQNIEASPSTPIQTGDGYWMISANSRTLNFSGTVPNVRVDSTFNFTLSPGWNLVSNPYPFPMSWNSVLVGNDNTQSVRIPLGFDGTFVEKTILQNFEGAYIFALEATILSIPVGNSDNNRQEDLISKPVFAGKNWSVNFDLNNESGNKFQLAGLGMHEEAQEGFDSFDMPLVPRMPNYVDLHFTEKSILGLPFMKDMVSQHEAYSWNMEVRSSKFNEKVSINWSTQNPQKGMGLLLVDSENGTRIDMLKTNEYSFTFNGPRNFTVEYVKVTSNEPTSSIFNPFLALPYPNPTQTEVNIPYSLPMGVHQYSLKILDMSGRDVALLEEGQKEEGHYLANYNINSLPQGVYLIVLELPNNANSRMTRKLMVK